MTHKNRLLIVDDEADVRCLFRDVAEDLGYEVAEAADRSQFIDEYARFDPELVLLDLTMPGGDGVELLRDLAARKCRCGVILASGRDKRVLATAERVGLSLGLQMRSPLQKPIAVADLEEALSNARPAENAGEPAPVLHAQSQAASTNYSELSDAIDEGQMEPYFQPKVDLQAEHGFPIIGAEALVRWNHPERGLVPPGLFIPLAEETGLIGKLTDVVLKSTIAHLQAWMKAGVAMPISINLSPKQLTDLTLPDHIADLLHEAGVDPSLLIVEVTEQAAMADIGAATDILTRLRLKDIQVSLDDFGAGYSSLVEIYRLPLSELKFDRSLIKDLDRDVDARTVVRALVPLARALDLSVCAEGIETAQTSAFLKEIGCHKAQGFHFSRPLPADQFEALLSDRRAFQDEGARTSA